jgi:hypothetical protein
VGHEGKWGRVMGGSGGCLWEGVREWIGGGNRSRGSEKRS